MSNTIKKIITSLFYYLVLVVTISPLDLHAGSATELNDIKDSIRFYISELYKINVTKEKLEFEKSYNGDSVINRIEFIKKHFVNITDFEMLWQFYTELFVYYGEVLFYEFYKKSLISNLPKISNEEFFNCGELSLKKINKAGMKSISSCELYLAYYFLLINAKKSDGYPILIEKVKHDQYLTCIAKYGDIIDDCWYPKNMDKNYDEILNYINKMTPEYMERYYKKSNSGVSRISVRYQDKMQLYQKMLQNSPTDQKVEKLYLELTSEPVQTFIKNMFKYGLKEDYNSEYMKQILDLAKKK